jgi:hypothetical protein
VLVRWACLCPALAALVGPAQNILFPHRTLIQFICPNRPGSRAGTPVSWYVYLVGRNTTIFLTEMFFDRVGQNQVLHLSKRLNKNKKRRTSFLLLSKIGSIPTPAPLVAIIGRTSTCHKEREDRETCRKENWVAVLAVSADGGGGGGRAGEGNFNDSKEGGLLYNSCTKPHGLIIYYKITVTAGVKPTYVN